MRTLVLFKPDELERAMQRAERSSGLTLEDEQRRAIATALSRQVSIVSGGPPTEHVHIAFTADDNEVVDRFHRDATAAGYRDNGAPGERLIYHRGYYGAFVLDPDGNNIEVVNHNR